MLKTKPQSSKTKVKPKRLPAKAKKCAPASLHTLERSSVKDVIAMLSSVSLQAEELINMPKQQLVGQINKISHKKNALKNLDLVSAAIEKLRLNFVDDARKTDTWAEKARQKSIETLDRFVSEGILVTPEVLMDRLGLTRQALSQAHKARRMYSVEVRGKSCYPAYFADPQYDRRQLEAVSKVLGDLPGTSKLQFMLTPKGALNGLTPLEALSKGKITEVKIAAQGFVER